MGGDTPLNKYRPYTLGVRVEGVGGVESELMGCQKIPYRTKAEALQVLRRMQREVRRGPIPIRVYWCQQHKAYHTTSRPKRKALP